MPKSREIYSLDVYIEAVNSIKLLSHEDHCDLVIRQKKATKKLKTKWSRLTCIWLLVSLRITGVQVWNSWI